MSEIPDEFKVVVVQAIRSVTFFSLLRPTVFRSSGTARHAAEFS